MKSYNRQKGNYKLQNLDTTKITKISLFKHVIK